MDGGPWTELGTLAWFVGVWVVMMAAMMFPSVAPTVALYSSMTKSRSPVAPLLFTSGYLVAWTSVGVFAFAVATAGGRISGDLLAWDRAGRWVAGATLVVAAVYESRRSRTFVSASAAVRSASCSAPGAADARVRSRWEHGTGLGVSAVAGR